VSDEAGAEQYHFDPATYLDMIMAEVPAYRELQRQLAEATAGVEAGAILELGVGTGETAAAVMAVHPAAALVGIDESEAMLARPPVAGPASGGELRPGRLRARGPSPGRGREGGSIPPRARPAAPRRALRPRRRRRPRRPARRGHAHRPAVRPAEHRRRPARLAPGGRAAASGAVAGEGSGRRRGRRLTIRTRSCRTGTSPGRAASSRPARRRAPAAPAPRMRWPGTTALRAANGMLIPDYFQRNPGGLSAMLPLDYRM